MSKDRSQDSVVDVSTSVTDINAKKWFGTGVFSRTTIKSLEDRDGLVNKIHKKNHWSRLTVLFVIIFTAYFGYKLFATTFAIIDRSGKPDALALQDSITPDQLQREGDGRVNVLLLGVGGGGHQGGDLSDVNHIISIDPFNNKAAILGLPRDLYVPIPGYYTTRINAAHAFGERDGGKGAMVAEQTVEDMLGIPIHYYAKVDFDGFEQAVDAVGGVDIKIDEDLYDPSYPTRDMSGTKVFQMEAGRHHLNGATALMVARCRKGTCGSDFGRADRQQKIMIAVKDKALSLGTIANPAKITQLLDAAGNHTRTDIGLTIMGKLLEVIERFKDKKVKPETFVLNTDADNYLTGANIGGAAVLIPKAGQDNFSDIQAFVRGKLFRDGFLAKENAKIAVLNGTGRVGLASSVATNLTSYGYSAEALLNVPSSTYSKTKIYKVGKKKSPFTTALLQKRLRTKISNGKMPDLGDIDKNVDYVVIAGDNL